MALPRSSRALQGVDARGLEESLSDLSLINNDPTLTFLDILNLIVEFKIPLIELSQLGLRIDPSSYNRSPYILGEGGFCSVFQHVLSGGETVNNFLAGTVVAIKKYTVANLDTGNASRKDLSATFSTIKQELSLFCNNTLRDHENICKLLFIGWERESPFPLLGLELAAHGSLDHVLRSAGFGPTRIQKCNITIDIAHGLAALHACNIAHGDIKSENIIIQEHADRGLIAKVSDFGGTANVKIPGAQPIHRTDLWLPPEGLFDDENVDWLKADIYSFGLLIVSVWLSFEEYQSKELSPEKSTCFLERFFPGSLTRDEKKMFLAVLKSEPDGTKYSMISRSFRVLKKDVAEMVDSLLNSSLSFIPQRRKSMDRVITEDLTALALAAGRTLPVQNKQENAKQLHTTVSKFKVWSPELQLSGPDFQSYVLEQMLLEVDEEFEFFDSFSAEYFGENASDNLLESLKAAISVIMNMTWSDDERMQIIARYAYHIGLCYLLGIGTSKSDELGIKWLSLSAIGGNALAILTAPVILDSCDKDTEYPGPYPLFLVICALFGSRKALSNLSIEFPRLHRAVRDIKTKRPFPEIRTFYTGMPFAIDVIVEFEKTNPVQPHQMDIWTALRTRNTERVRSIIDNSENLSTTKSDGSNVLHYLSLLGDKDAADLAIECFHKGARLGLKASNKEFSHFFDTNNQAQELPLAWAVEMGKFKLFKALLSLHVEHEKCIVQFDSIVSKCVKLLRPLFLEELLKIWQENPSMCVTQRDIVLEILLHLAIAKPDMITIGRRIEHGPKYTMRLQETVTVLINFDANPLLYGDHSALFAALVVDDSSTFNLCLDYLVKSEKDPVRYLTRVDFAAEEQKYTALQIAIYKRAYYCFNILLDRFPELIEETNAVGIGALQSAVLQGETNHLARRLIDKGAKIFVWSKDRSSPLFEALRGGNMEAVEMMASQCDENRLIEFLNRNPEDQTTILSRLVSCWTTDKSLNRLRAIEWVIEKGGAKDSHFISDESHNWPLWNHILARLPPSINSQRSLDKALLRDLFDTYTPKLEYVDGFGMAPIHLAAMSANIDALDMLLSRNVNINQETQQGASNLQKPGRTALDIAISLRQPQNLPKRVMTGAMLNIRQWRGGIEAVIHRLVTNGAKPGSGTTGLALKEAEMLMDPEKYANVHLTVIDVSNPRPLAEDKVFRGAWPRPLPRDSSSPSEELMVKTRKGVRMVMDLTAQLPEKPPEPASEDMRRNIRQAANALKASRKAGGLPRGWEARRLEDGKILYVDHNTKLTTQRHPYQ